MDEISYKGTLENVKLNDEYYKIHDIDTAADVEQIKANYIKIPDKEDISKGDILYWDEDKEPQRLAAQQGKFLQVASSGLPTWSDATNVSYEDKDKIEEGTIIGTLTINEITNDIIVPKIEYQGDFNNGTNIGVLTINGNPQNIIIPKVEYESKSLNDSGSIGTLKVGNESYDINITKVTTTAPGLMSKDDKIKLDGIASGAEVNQNAFSNIKIGNTTISADNKTDSLTFVAGNNITLTPDSTNDKITIQATDTTYSAATTSAAGLMSASDKTKLNGIATGATANTGTVTSVATSGAITGGPITSSGTISHSTAAGYKHIPSGGSANQVLVYNSSSGTAKWANNEPTALNIGGTVYTLRTGTSGGAGYITFVLD